MFIQVKPLFSPSTRVMIFNVLLFIPSEPFGAASFCGLGSLQVHLRLSHWIIPGYVVSVSGVYVFGLTGADIGGII
jgi:hypothetical protein